MSIELYYLRQLFEQTKERLFIEIDALGRRANINLTIGSATAIIGMIILGIAVFTNQHSDKFDLVAQTGYFLPRFTFVILIELFSYFFLRLYRTSLFEIKYFQNELTNVESKFTALEGALASGSDKEISAIYLQLAKTERNFVLKKGESTVDLRREENEIQAHTSVLEAIEKIAEKMVHRTLKKGD